jgi:hypothetical protein
MVRVPIRAVSGSVDASADRIVSDIVPDFVETGAISAPRRGDLMSSSRFAFASKLIFKSSPMPRGLFSGSQAWLVPKESRVGIRIKIPPVCPVTGR